MVCLGQCAKYKISPQFKVQSSPEYNNVPIPPVKQKAAEEKVRQLEGERAKWEQQVRQANETYQNIAEDLRLMTGERDKATQEKTGLEVCM